MNFDDIVEKVFAIWTEEEQLDEDFIDDKRQLTFSRPILRRQKTFQALWVMMTMPMTNSRIVRTELAY